METTILRPWKTYYSKLISRSKSSPLRTTRQLSKLKLVKISDQLRSFLLSSPRTQSSKTRELKSCKGSWRSQASPELLSESSSPMATWSRELLAPSRLSKTYMSLSSRTCSCRIDNSPCSKRLLGKFGTALWWIRLCTTPTWFHQLHSTLLGPTSQRPRASMDHSWTWQGWRNS